MDGPALGPAGPLREVSPVPAAAGGPAAGGAHSLRLISYNIQCGLSTRRYSEYLTRSWRQVLPDRQRIDNLDAIAGLITDYDIVALQEVDLGSMRTGFMNQARYLAHRGQFGHLYDQSTRRIGPIAQHGNALLSRVRPARIEDHRLPGAIPGRALLSATFGEGPDALHVFIVHLSLGRRGRLRQMNYLIRLIGRARNVIVMGDLNCRPESRELEHLLRFTMLRRPRVRLDTFPSWQPDRQLDHILVSPTIRMESVSVLWHTYSDHLPIAMEIAVPDRTSKVGLSPAS